MSSQLSPCSAMSSAPIQNTSPQVPYEHKTISGHKGLCHKESLIFEQNTRGLCGVDWPEVDLPTLYTNLPERSVIGLPGLSEPQVVRHYTRLSQKNYAIDSGFYPLGSCTMKHNPRLNEKVARFFGGVHPFQPGSTLQGLFQVMDRLAFWLTKLTGMAAIALTPAAGAQGELCGMMAIRAALKARGKEGEDRSIVLVPASAHGTNPATAAACGFTVQTLPVTPTGRVDLEHLKKALTPEVAAIMLTNPNTCGLFESDCIEIADLIHANGSYFYCDGANFNAIVGRVRPADLGVDCMHINLHKTFSTPHGGGGPGSGPVVFAESLAPYIPVPYVVQREDGSYKLVEENAQSIGRLKAFHGQVGMFTRALAYILSHGADGLKKIAEDAVLNANYLLSQLKEHLSAPFPDRCCHEAVFSDAFLHGTGVSTLDFAKALIDEGYHPMTIYFPLVVPGAMLIEPTESESKATLNEFISVIKGLVERIHSSNDMAHIQDFFHGAPYLAPSRRLDETAAARSPKLACSQEEPGTCES